MCGIAGTLNFKTTNEDLIIINESILNRGPDGSGYLNIDEFNLKLFHTRLAITDFTKKGEQPFTSQNKRFIIIFNGEIYNYKDLKKKLFDEGVYFQSSSDTEVLIEAISKWGLQKTLETIHGMFVFCLLDRDKKKLFLVRDSFGEKHLFYYKDKNKLIFSSEISTINNLTKTNISDESVYKLLEYSYIESPSSIYSNVKKLEPGQVIEYDINQNELNYTSKYFLDKKKLFETISNDSVFSEYQLKSVLRESIDNISKDYEKKIGVFLSSGIDSSLIFTEIAKKNDNLNSYTIGFEGEESEIDSAISLSKKFNVKNVNKVLKEDDVIENLKIINNIYNEPLCDPSCIPMISLCKMASKDVKVAISGDASDEIFGGYNRYKLYNNILSISELGSFILKNDLIKKLINNHIFQNNNLSKFTDNIINKQFSSAYEIIIKNNYRRNNLHVISQDAKFKNDKELNKLDKKLIPLFCDLNSYLPDNIFQKTDKASMFYGLEVRTPFTNYELANLGISHYKHCNYKNNKKPLLDLLKENYYEYEIRKIKKGFGIPKKFFSRKKIFDFLLQNIYDTKNLNEFVNNKFINKIILDYKIDPNKNFQKFFTLSNLSLWLKNQ